MKSSANAVGGKTARACDSCVKRRARWYCPSDDAFLCQACDGSVHSANPLARRHERVRLKSASSSRTHRPTTVSPPGTAKWHHGFTRKARTPRGSGSAGKPNQRAVFFHDLVPEISVEDQTENYEEEQLIFQVPVLDPTVSEQYRDDAIEEKTGFPLPELIKFADMNEENDEDNAESCLDRFFPTDMELAEFAADVDTLLGHNLETESFATEDLGLGDGLSVCGRSSSMMLKLENEDVHEEETVAREGTPMELFYERKGMPFELSFDQDHSHRAFEEEEEDEEKNVINVNTGERESVRSGGSSNISHSIKKKNVLMLRLNHEAVISTWGGKGPPWTAGRPPELDLDDNSWHISMGENGNEVPLDRYGGRFCGLGLQAAMMDGGREARVSRYREKRRTRLFSKKIRYEVRKLNAEKRPRMKGRFVKRASIASITSSLPLLTK